MHVDTIKKTTMCLDHIFHSTYFYSSHSIMKLLMKQELSLLLIKKSSLLKAIKNILYSLNISNKRKNPFLFFNYNIKLGAP